MATFFCFSLNLLLCHKFQCTQPFFRPKSKLTFLWSLLSLYFSYLINTSEAGSLLGLQYQLFRAVTLAYSYLLCTYLSITYPSLYPATLYLFIFLSMYLDGSLSPKPSSVSTKREKLTVSGWAPALPSSLCQLLGRALSSRSPSSLQL